MKPVDEQNKVEEKPSNGYQNKSKEKKLAKQRRQEIELKASAHREPSAGGNDEADQ